MSTGIQDTARNSTYSLKLMFQIVTAAGLFFGLFRVFPEVAVTLGMLISPAIVRTAWAADAYRMEGIAFPWSERLRCFFSSFLVVMAAGLAGLAAFALVSMLFGLLALVFGAAVGLGDLGFDTAIVGTAGGMIWGLAAALLVVGFVLYTSWPIDLEKSKASSDAV